MSNGASFSCLSSERVAPGDLFGVWRLEPAQRDRSFAARDVPLPPPGLLWRIEFSSDTSRAQVDLEDAAKDLQLASQRMDTVLGRLAAYAHKGGAGRSFSVAGVVQGEAERELDALLRKAGEGPGQSYALEGITDSWAEVVEEFRTFVAGVVRVATNYAWVETRIDGRLVVQTCMGWDGDVRSIGQSKLHPDEALLHYQALDLAIHSRDEVLRLFALATQGAVIVAAAVSSPVGPLLALPAAYRFIKQALHGK